MAKWVRSGVLDNGLNDIKGNASKMYLISAYTAGDSYATVIANALNAGVTMASGDYVLSPAGSNRVLTTVAGKSDIVTVSATGSPDLHVAFTDGAANVIWVTDETSNVPVSIGNTLTFPSITYTSNQPI
jgi:hypothetical protein